MQDEMRRYLPALRERGSPPVEARVGVNTGEVVVRSIESGDRNVEYAPIGHSTNLAARMQTLAPTGSIATTATTERLCEGYFSFKLLGPARCVTVWSFEFDSIRFSPTRWHSMSRLLPNPPDS
jgi:class 3 adenylate cyclase